MKKIISVILLFLMCLLCACADNKETVEKNDEVKLDESEYLVYYLDKENSKLESKIYKAQGMDASLIAKNLLNEIGVEASTLHTEHIDGIYAIDFDEDYLELKGVLEILQRAAIVLTLTQVEGIEYVGITVNGQPIVDMASNTVGNMKADSFVLFTEDFPKGSRKTNVKLYFSDTSGKMLKSKDIECKYDYSIPYEKLIVDELIKGINEDSYKSTLPINTVINSVSTKNSICYVDFNGSVLDSVPPVGAELMIYSIVNSLSELSHITKVQFSVDGSSNAKLYNEIDLTNTFSRNLDLVIIEEK